MVHGCRSEVDCGVGGQEVSRVVFLPRAVSLRGERGPEFLEFSGPRAFCDPRRQSIHDLLRGKGGNGGRSAVALFKVGGKVYCLDNSCTHVGGPLCQGTLHGTVVQCPLHGSRFDVRSGQVVGPPPAAWPLNRLNARSRVVRSPRSSTARPFPGTPAAGNRRPCGSPPPRRPRHEDRPLPRGQR